MLKSRPGRGRGLTSITTPVFQPGALAIDRDGVLYALVDIGRHRRHSEMGRRHSATRLHAAVQTHLQEATAENREFEVLAQARQCAAEGMKRHRQGQHWESTQTLRRCLTLLE